MLYEQKRWLSARDAAAVLGHSDAKSCSTTSCGDAVLQDLGTCIFLLCGIPKRAGKHERAGKQEVRHLSMGQLVVQTLELRGEGVAQRWPASEVRGGGGRGARRAWDAPVAGVSQGFEIGDLSVYEAGV